MALVQLTVFGEDFRQIAEVSHGWRCDEPGVIVVPIDHPAAKWIIDHGEPASCLISIRWNGTNFGGVLEGFECIKSDCGDEVLRATFNSDGFSEAHPRYDDD